MNAQENNKRVPGGFGWADAILRSNVNTQGYIKHITQVINLRLFNNEEVLTYAVGSAGFLVLIGDKVLIKGGMDFVENCRAVSVTQFERVIVSRLLEMGYELDKGDRYY